MRDASPYQQKFTNDSKKPWAKSKGMIKITGKLIIGEIDYPTNLARKEIFNLVTQKKLTGGIINSFLNTLKVNNAVIEVICPLSFSSLNNEQRITDSVKYVINK